MARDFLKLDDQQYYLDPAVKERSVLEALKKDDYLGVYIGAPQKVDISSRDRIPLVVAERRAFKDIMVSPFDKFAVAVAVDIDRGTVFDGLVVQLPEGIEPLVPDVDSDAEEQRSFAVPEGWSSQMHVVDLVEIAGVPMCPAKIMVTVFLGHTRSNRSRINLVGNKMSRKEDNSAGFRTEKGCRDIGLSAVGVNHPKIADYPYPLGSEQGISLVCSERYSLAEQAVVVHGAFSMPIYKEHKPVYAPNPEQGLAVPVALLVFGSKQGYLGCLRLVVYNVDEIADRAESGMVRGYFSINLSEHFSLGSDEQQYTLYALSRQFVSQPASFILSM